MPRKASKPKTSRRGKNEGSVYKRNDGKWVGQVTVGYRRITASRFGNTFTPVPGKKRPARLP